MEEKFIELDVSKIRQVPSDTEIPVHDNYGHTERALCTEFPQNKEILTKLEAVFNQEHVTECTSDLFKGDYETIVKIDDLKKALSELLIRFDTSPNYYTKEDYQYLMYILSYGLLHLYEITETIEEPDFNINGQKIEKIDNAYNISIGQGNGIEIQPDTENNGIKVKAKIGQMNDENSTNLATVDDVRAYIEGRLKWKVNPIIDE